MSSESYESLQKEIERQGNFVRHLKKEHGAEHEETKAAIATLLDLKQRLQQAGGDVAEAKKRAAERAAKFETLLKRKMFVVPSFEIHGGVGGLFDFGPPGCALMANMQQVWRQHFVLEEDMLEISGPALTPHVVLKTSGHVDKFTDLMVKDVETGDCHRADKLLEEHLEGLMEDPSLSEEARTELKVEHGKADAYSPEELHAVLQKYDIKAPGTGNDLTAPFPFNLMFQTSIGPAGNSVGYLRPETAQGIFVNFRRLLDYNGKKMPFAAAQIGSAFRNEIAPRNGLLRVREFTLAEIEHFVNPEDKSHPKFDSVAELRVPLLSASQQEVAGDSELVALGDAVAQKIIDSETLAYFLGRTFLFLTKCGVDPERLRFRQHLKTEMAHYACDCWDAEIYTTYGWVECVGHADRSAYDLEVHAKASGVDLSASETLDPPQERDVHEMKLNKRALGKTFKREQKVVAEYLTSLSKSDAIALNEAVQAGPHTVELCTGKSYELTADMFELTVQKKMVHQLRYTPNVIEPSFGLGRIFYCILEHSFDDTMYADDDARVVLKLPAQVAPFKAGVLSLSRTAEFFPFAKELVSSLNALNLASKTDLSGAAIGRKYARADELGMPYCFTIDFDTVANRTITLRHRDTAEQVRLALDEAAVVLARLCSNTLSWDDAKAQYTVVSQD